KPQRHFDAMARKKNAPRNGGMAACKATLRCCDEESTSADGVPERRHLGGVGNSYKEACVLGAAGYGSKGGCGIFNTNQNFLNRFLFGNGDFDVNVWNRGVYTSK